MSPEDSKRKQLGRGLGALFGEHASEPTAVTLRGVRQVPIGQIRPNRLQPRKHFDDEQLAELARSIREQGVLQPVLLRRDAEHSSHFELVAGERRWRAAQLAQLHEIPAIVKDLSDREALEVALIENLQREDLTAIEEADAYKRLMEEFGHTQERLSDALGVSRSHIANALRLLELPEPVREMIASGKLSFGHARVLAGAVNPLLLAQHVVDNGLTVRETERLAKNPRDKRHPRAKDMGADPNTVALERALTAELGIKVRIVHSKTGGSGRMTIYYDNVYQIDDVIKLLRGGVGGLGLAHGNETGAEEVVPKAFG
ncbi:MAG: ParB/RepB/Spo0J family partition protein [Proteobacteria bacterium]|nr:ParB/RepB/Spo0J family partition protein [Pseudomonadota bacterium]